MSGYRSPSEASSGRSPTSPHQKQHFHTPQTSPQSRHPRESSEYSDAYPRDSHDLSLGGRGRESLLDNLLLSFDHIGGAGAFGGQSALGGIEGFGYFSTVDEVEDTDDERDNPDQNYPDGRRLYGSTGGGSLYEGGSFGVTYENPPSSRETRSRSGRGLDSSHGYTDGFDPYGPAPAPSIRTRNRTPSPPRSPRLVRPPSNKSIRSLRRGDPQFSNPFPDEPVPPLPAFAAGAAPAPAMTPSSKPTSSSSNKPGLFRRFFGGGGGSANAGTTPAGAASVAPPAVSEANQSPASVSSSSSRPAPPPVPATDPPAVVTKKPSSFFRRRKKSVTDTERTTTPVKRYIEVPQPLSETNSPNDSLRNAMKPFIPSPNWQSTSFDPAPSDAAKQRKLSAATIRTVASSDQVASRRPSAPAISKSFAGTPSTSRKGSLIPDDPPRPVPERVQSVDSGRPQTSPASPRSSMSNDFPAEYDEETIWPPLMKRGPLHKMSVISDDGLVSTCSRVNSRKNSTNEPTVSVTDHGGKRSDETARQGKLGIDTTNLDAPMMDESWLQSAAPLSPSMLICTPTVTISREANGGRPEVLEGDEEDEERRMAQRIWDGDEEFIAKSRACAWLGDEGEARERVRKAYLGLFNWKGVNILSAMRILCTRLILRGETQQVDRILASFSERWCECNPRHGFKSVDVVHTILYSVLMLNTDLHIADLASGQRMTRSQFVKNTMYTIKQTLEEISQEVKKKEQEECEAELRKTVSRSPTPCQDEEDDALAPVPTMNGAEEKYSAKESKTSRMSLFGLSPRIMPEDSNESDDVVVSDGDLALVNADLAGGFRVWETQVEVILKDFYTSIKANPLPLHGSTSDKGDSSAGYSLFGGGMLRRSPSVVSKAPSELSLGPRYGTGKNSNLNTKWTSKNRSRGRVYNGSFAGSSRTSLEDRSSIWSPSASSTWSKYSLDKTQTSMSVDSLASSCNPDYQQSIGFASALSNAIIREEGASAHSGMSDHFDLLDDEDLELSGAPWAKEGLLKHKHHLESADKRSKNRNWNECFAVIQRGYMRLFSFNKDSKQNRPANGVFGGGNWTENAEPIGSFLLRQTLASALPPPGYSKSRPNVWALSLPSGAVHFFEVGTADIVREFVTTANYWSARLSKEPLVGGVSNVEYGWGDCIADYLGCAPLETAVTTDSTHKGHAARPSLQMSIRSSIDQAGVRARLPGDKVNIKEWTPPTQSMVASSLPEAEQLRALVGYVESVEAELARHNELRGAMQVAFSPKHPNGQKAFANWEKKSAYLLREIIKFRTYIETLQSAAARREAVLAERAAYAAQIEAARGESAQ